MSNDVNFKKLNELEVIEEAGESTYAVVEENGVPKRIPGKKLGGGGKFVVTFATEDNSTFTADKTYAEIDAAYNAGQEMLCAKTSNGNTLFGSLAAVMPGMGYGFAVINATPIGIAYMMYLVSPDNSVIMQEITGAVEGK